MSKLKASASGRKVLVSGQAVPPAEVAEIGYRCLSYTDPFGLAPCPPDNDCVNPLKIAVGAVNAVRGTIKLAQGATNVLSGTATTPVLGVGVPAAALGSIQLAQGFASLNRGSQQIVEGVEGDGGASWKNLLGLLPAGQEFDDPDEPGLREYITQRYRQLRDNPRETLRRLINEYFATPQEER